LGNGGIGGYSKDRKGDEEIRIWGGKNP